MLKVKLLSDIHLEKLESYPGIAAFIPEKDEIDVICLCGDIGDPRDLSYTHFLRDCANKCNIHTFVIMGNHEAYGDSIQNTTKVISTVCDIINKQIGKEKAVFLNNSYVDVHDYRFMGTTLWTDIDPSEAWNIRCSIADFQYIKGWGIGESISKFHENVAWLRVNIQAASEDNKKAVILSHHVPLLSLGNPEYAGSPLKSAFASDLSEFIKQNTDTISYWFYGHDHYSATKKVGNTIIMSNQKGYYDEENNNMNDRIIDI